MLANQVRHNPVKELPRWLPFLGCFLILLLQQQAAAATREVGTGQTYTTIQACLNAAVAGDICNVHAGTYNESPSFPRAGITLQRNSSDVVTVIGSMNLQSFGSGTVVDGFRVTGYGTSS